MTLFRTQYFGTANTIFFYGCAGKLEDPEEKPTKKPIREVSCPMGGNSGSCFQKQLSLL